MSTFGKKYLNYWPYRFDEKITGDGCLRWNKTDKDFQLEILKKCILLECVEKPF